MSGRNSELTLDAKRQKVFYQAAGKRRKVNYSFFRGANTNFHPDDDAFARNEILADHVVKGLMPAEPIIAQDTPVVAFGSCFAAHIGDYLAKTNFNVETRRDSLAYVSRMGDGIVNTFAIRQQFEWAWEGWTPQNNLWHDSSATALEYDERVRLRTKQIFDRAQIFVLTFGLSEVWYDEPTGEVFWKAVPYDCYDADRHKFRVASHAENLTNMRRIHELIRRYRPDAYIVTTLSPIALSATFREIPCIVANSASKATLRAALDEFHRLTEDPRLFYFPSYEIALACFRAPLMEDRKHVHKFVLDFNMKVFERYFCKTGMTDLDLLKAFRSAQKHDRRVTRWGAWSIPRVHLLWSTPWGPVHADQKRTLKDRAYFWLRRRWFGEQSADR